MTDTPARILVVDDDPSARDIVRRRLEMQGYEILLAENGWEALERIEKDLPDLVILDMMMPGLDGIGVIKRVRSNPSQVSLPILMLTARDRAVDKQFGLESGADDYLGKPFEFPELMARVQALLRRSRGWTIPGELVRRGHVVTFTGAKGGVGTTTIAVNVAVALARRGTSTIIAELTGWNGGAASRLGVPARRRIDRLPLNRPEILTTAMVENTLLEHNSGLKILAGRVGAIAEVADEGWTALIEMTRRSADVVVIDTDGAPTALTMAAARVSTQLWVVTEPEPISVERAAAWIDYLDENGVSRRRIGLIVNTTSPVMVVSEADITRATGIQPTYTLPAMPNACYAAAARGIPIVDLSAQLPASRIFTAFAAAVINRPGTVLRPENIVVPGSAQPMEVRQ